MSTTTQGLRVVGPGGPYEVMAECAEAFSRSRSVAVEVSKGPPERWLDRHADLIYGGFPQMLTALAQAHPEALSTAEIHELYERRIGLLVRRGNPCHLLTLADLSDPDIQVLDVQLEQMEEFQGCASGLLRRCAPVRRESRRGEPGRNWTPGSRSSPGIARRAATRTSSPCQRTSGRYAPRSLL